jgi:hypothetical protein
MIGGLSTSLRYKNCFDLTISRTDVRSGNLLVIAF